MLCADKFSIPQFFIICSLTYIIINILPEMFSLSLLFMYCSLMFSVPLLMASVICSKLSIPSSVCFCTTTLYIVPMSTSCSLIFLIPVRSINISSPWKCKVVTAGVTFYPIHPNIPKYTIKSYLLYSGQFIFKIGHSVCHFLKVKVDYSLQISNII